MEELLTVIESNNIINKMLNNCPYYILTNMELLSVKSKKFHLYQGSIYDYVYIIVSGEVKIFVSEENGRQILLDIYTTGNFIGEHEAFINQPYSASVESLTDCLLIKIPNNTFLDWVKQDEHFNQLVIHSLCYQMNELTNRAAKYSLSTVKEQVIETILDLNETKHMVDKKLLLASISATSRSVYRVLNDLEQANLIEITSKEIKIIDKKRVIMEGKKV